jgi:hypothetical protein
MFGLHVKQLVNEIHGLCLLVISETMLGAENQGVDIVGILSEGFLQRKIRRRKVALFQQDFCLFDSGFQIFIHGYLSIRFWRILLRAYRAVV